MSGKFRIYSTDISPTLTPDTSWILPYKETGSDNAYFFAGETVTGNAGATGIVLTVHGTAATGELVITKTNSISFVDGEVITGSASGLAEVDSATGGTASSTNIAFDQDPLSGEYAQATSGKDRGSTIRTLDGVVIQDLGVVIADEIISFSDKDALTQSTITALITAYETVDGEWYFTDGYNCWKVQFSRNPRGMVARRNMVASFYGITIFSYEITLLVLSKEI